MSIRIKCPACQVVHKMNERSLGHTLSCPRCNGEIKMPSREQYAAALEKKRQREAAAVAVAEKPKKPISLEKAAVAAVTEALPVEEVEEVQIVEAMPVDINIPISGKVPVVTAVAVEDPIVKASQVNPKKPAAVAKPIKKKEDEAEPPALEPAKNRDNTELDMTPMIDVTFLLLIFFVVTASFQIQKAMEVPKSKSDAPSSAAVPEDVEQVEEVTVQIDPNNTFMVLAPDWEREVPGRQNLMNALREARQSVDEDSPMKLIVEAHVDSKHKTVVEALDVGAELRFTELQLVEVEEFE